jgi:hypothetical protein
MIMAVATGCRHGSSTTGLVRPTDASIHTAVLRDVSPDSATRWVVLDTLLPTIDLEADQYDSVREHLSISERELRDFIAAQQHATRRIVAGMLPDARWRVVSATYLDSLRAAARHDVTNGTAARGVRNDQFWQLWFRTFPGSGGYVVLSPASVSRDGGLALVHVRIACGPVCGESELRVLRRSASGDWRTTARVRLSES